MMLTIFLTYLHGPLLILSLQTGLVTEISVFSSADFFTLWNPGTETESTSALLMKDLLLSLLRIVFVLVGVAYFTLAERKIMASVQRRRGPNVVGIFGLLQPLADGLKLLCKEMVIPSKSNTVIFLIAPLAIIMLSLVGWAVIPFSPAPSLNSNTGTPGWFMNTTAAAILATGHDMPTNEWLVPTRNFYYPLADLNLSILFVLAISSLNVYGIIIAGWASNSKYAFLGSLRSAAQMISYEVSIGLTMLPVILLAGSSNFTEIILAQERTVWFAAPLLPCAAIFFVSMLAETNRAPFDLPEAEAELVAGYNVEYSSMIFAMFFLGEYSNMLLMSAMITVLFFGGWSPMIPGLLFISPQMWFAVKMAMFCFLFVLVRATFPRYRYDQLMDIGWKVFLPMTLAFLFFCASLLYSCEASPLSWEIESF